jgi:hypothetical protein
MLNVIYGESSFYCYAECRYPECHSAELSSVVVVKLQAQNSFNDLPIF